MSSDMDRFTIAVVGGVLGLVVAGLVAAAIMRGHAPQPDVSTPSGIVLTYGLAEQRGDGQAAWELLATSVQTRNNRDQFLVRFSGHGNGAEYLTTEDERVDADGASVVMVRTYPSSGGIFGNSNYTNRTTVRLAREAAGWRITVPPDPYVLIESKP
jgi:hypothetical protein